MTPSTCCWARYPGEPASAVLTLLCAYLFFASYNYGLDTIRQMPAAGHITNEGNTKYSYTTIMVYPTVTVTR